MSDNRKPLRRFLTSAVAAVSAVALVAGCASTGEEPDAEQYPNGPIELFVGASAGGSTDQLARQLARELGPELGVEIIVTNKPGGNGATAFADVASRPADGQTLMLVSGSLITITPLFVEPAAAISVDDFSMVSGVGKEGYILVTNKNSGLNSIEDLVNAGRNIKYGTAGHGTGGFLSQKLLFDALNIDSTDVPFQGGGPAVTALLGNEVDVASVQELEAKPHIESGDFIPLLTYGEERSKFYPNIPTAKEAGYDSVVGQSRFLLAAKGTPDDIIEKLNEALARVFAKPAYQDFLKNNFIDPDETGPAETVTNLENTRKDYESKARAAGLL